MTVASGLSYGHTNRGRHAAAAVALAMEKVGLTQVNGIVLFMTPDDQTDVQTSLRSAARTGGCTQVVGCVGPGILTDEDWVVAVPGAAALVFGGGIRLLPGVHKPLSLLLSNTEIGTLLRNESTPLVGTITGDTAGADSFAVWYAGRPASGGRVTVTINGVRAATGLAQGIRALNSPMVISKVRQHDVLTLDDRAALESLEKCQRELGHRDPGGNDELIYAVIDDDNDRLVSHIIALDSTQRSVTLAERVAVGQRLWWGVRDPKHAAREMSDCIDGLHHQLGVDPQAALLFPSVQRGAEFYGIRDHDLDALLDRFPDMPIAGLYGHDQIAHVDGRNRILQFATALALLAPVPD
jgi:small ligand-binding sensory domain FIST